MLKTFDVELPTGGNARLSACLLDPADDFTELGTFEKKKKRPAVVIMPGGGYTFLSIREAEPVALCYSAKGFQTFILWYSLLPDWHWPQQLIEAAEAMTQIRTHAEEWDVDPDKIAVCGFSAGGNLAGSIATFFDSPVLTEKGYVPELVRPNAEILCYAGLRGGEGDRFEARWKNKLGENYGDPRLEVMRSVAGAVTPANPPAFIWQTANDDMVNPENSLEMASALGKAGVSYELHIFPDGIHGLSLGTEITVDDRPAEGLIKPAAAQWMDMSIRWMTDLFKL